MRKLHLAAALCASSVLVPCAAFAQSNDNEFSGPPCDRLVNYLQEYPDYDFPVTMSEARQLRDDNDAEACTDRMQEINASLGYGTTGDQQADNAVGSVNRSDQDRTYGTSGTGTSQVDDQELGTEQDQEQRQRPLAEHTRQDQESQRSANLRARDGAEDRSARNGERSSEGRIIVRQRPSQIMLDRAAPQVTVRQQEPTVNVQQPRPQITVHQPAPTVTIDIPQPEITVRMPRPDVQVSNTRPEVSVRQPEPQVRFSQQGEPEVNVDRADANVQYEGSGDPNVQISRSQEADIRYEREEAQVRVNQPQGQPQVRFEQSDGQSRASDRDQARRELNNDLRQNDQTASANRSRDDQWASEGADRDERARNRQAADNRNFDGLASAQNDQRRQGGGLDRPADSGWDNSASERMEQDSDRTALDRSVGDATMPNDRGSFQGDSTARMENQNGVTITSDELVGATVYSRDNESIGDVGEVLFADNGDVDAVVIDVGGFLGMGEKPVAVAFSALDIRTSGQGELVVRTDLTEQEFDSVEQYDPDSFDRERNRMVLTAN
jgi:hypothetical protein